MKNILSGVIALAALFSVTTTAAQNPNLRSPLTTTDEGKTMKLCYDISGLGNVSSVLMKLTYDAFVQSECYNPGSSAGPVPGQSKSYPSQSDEFTVPVHNGRATGYYTTEREFPAGACPNNKWTGSVSDVTFSNITLSVLKKTFVAPNPQ